MKARIIYFGWAISWLFLFGGIGTMDTSEFGSGRYVLGILLCMVWFAFSWLLILNEKECAADAEKLEKWIDEVMMKINKWF